MAVERYVVLGLAHARSPWFRSLGSWANSGALPVELVKCVSAAEVRARLGGGRRFSALLADAGVPSFDRDLIAAARSADCAVIVVDDGRVSRDWLSLGVARVLAAGFDREDLLAALGAHAHLVRRSEAAAADVLNRPSPPLAWRAPVAVVTGPGGTGASTAAIALAQALGHDVRHGGMVVLADLRLHAEQAMLHDARDLVPSVQELVEAHRAGQPSPETVRSLTFAVAERGYSLLLGLGRARFWAAIRPEAFVAAFDSLRGAYRAVVCDVDCDLEGEDAGGSVDVEERHVMSRTAALQADVVFPVGLPGMKGLHSLVRVVAELVSIGVPPRRIVPVVNRAPASARARAGITSAVAALLAPSLGATGSEPREAAGDPATVANPVFLPDRPIEKALRDGTRLPPALGSPLAGAFHALAARPTRRPSGLDAALRVKPGTLGKWAGQEAAR